MKTIKVGELTGAALDWVVAKAKNPNDEPQYGWNAIKGAKVWLPYSTNWGLAGPIIEHESITIIRCDDEYGTDKRGFTTSKRIPVWGAVIGLHDSSAIYGSQGDNWGVAYSIDEDEVVYGPTPLIAAMRCYCCSKLGDTVEVPEELA